MKKVLLFAPDWVGFIAGFEKNLRYCGYDVVTVNQNIPPFKYKNRRQKIYNFFRKTFLNDLTYKQKLKEEHLCHHRYQFSTPADVYDYALIVRADMLDINELRLIKQISGKMISYHFDALPRYPEIFERINYFDKFFVFDPADVVKYPQYNLKFITNFYFDYPERNKWRSQSPEYNLFYLGSYESSRIHEILQLQNFLTQNEISHKIELFFDQTKLNKITPDLKNTVTCLTESISIEKHQEYVAKSNVLLDFILPQHTGLSFRVFESIKYEKKLITNNPHIINYDFYTPDNIFILDSNYDALADFLDQPYIPLPASVRKKYSFTNWISNVFKQGAFEKIQREPTKKYALSANL